MSAATDPDGSGLLGSPQVSDLLRVAAGHAGGVLLDWRLHHIDASPRHSTTATYAATVDWPSGRRPELFGASVRVGGRSGTDERAVIFSDGEREVAVWLYPDDPDLPGLRRAAAAGVRGLGGPSPAPAQRRDPRAGVRRDDRAGAAAGRPSAARLVPRSSPVSPVCHPVRIRPTGTSTRDSSTSGAV